MVLCSLKWIIDNDKEKHEVKISSWGASYKQQHAMRGFHLLRC